MNKTMNFIKDETAQLAVLEGIVIGLSLITISIVLTMAIGPITDILVPEIVGLNTEMNVPEEVNTLPAAMRNITLIHIMLRSLGILGVVILVVSVVKKTRYDTQLRSEEEEIY